jgi:hypothetical protein
VAPGRIRSHGSSQLRPMKARLILAHAFFDIRCLPSRDSCLSTTMSMLRHVSRQRHYICQHHARRQLSVKARKSWAGQEEDAAACKAAWDQQAGRIRSGAQQSMLSILEERGFVKDVAG